MTAQLALRLKERALCLVARDRAYIIYRVREELKDLYRQRQAQFGPNAFVTGDDARRISGDLDMAGYLMPTGSNWRGAIFRSKEWEPCGQHVSSAPQGHGNRILRWRLRG